MTNQSPPILATIRRLPPAAWILLAGTFINRFGAFILIFLVLYLTDKGYSGTQAGLALSIYGMGQMVAATLGGHLADRVGRRTTIVGSMYTAAIAMVLLYHAESLWAIILLTGVVGATAEMYRPAAAALLTDFSAPGERVTVFATYRLAVNLGFMLGPAVGGFLAERSFAWLFYGDALTCIVFATLAWTTLPGGRGASDHISLRKAWATILGDRVFVRFLIASTLVIMMFFQPASGWALQVKAWGHSTSVYGMLLSLNGLLVLLFELPITTLTRNRSARHVIALGYAVMGIGFGLTVFAATAPLLALTVVIWTMGEIINAPVAVSYVSSLAPEKLRGRYHGAFGLTWGVGMMAGPIMGTVLFGYNPAVLWATCLLLGLGAAALILKR